jgi:hypothetical protein
MWEAHLKLMLLAQAGFFHQSWQDCGGDVDGDTSAKGNVTYTGIYRDGQQMVVDLGGHCQARNIP